MTDTFPLRPHAGDLGLLAVVGRERVERRGVRDRHDLWAGVHGVRDGGGSEEGRPGSHRAHRHRVHRRRQHLGGRGVRRRVHEPGSLIRPSGGQLDLGQPLGLLGRPVDRGGHRSFGLRRCLHRPGDPRAASHLRLLGVIGLEFPLCSCSVLGDDLPTAQCV